MVGIRKEVRIGLVGYKFMGKAHSHAYQSLSTFFQFGVKPVKQAFVEEMRKRLLQILWMSTWLKLLWRLLRSHPNIGVGNKSISMSNRMCWRKRR